MRLLLIGCEYTGKKTLAKAISRWMIDSMGLSVVRWHDHFVVPQIDRHLLIYAEGEDEVIGKADVDLNTDEDEEQIMSLRPSVLEQLQRHNIWRHLHPGLFRNNDALFINHYYADAVYAPLYYGYGEPGSFADRRAREGLGQGVAITSARYRAGSRQSQCRPCSDMDGKPPST